VKTDDSERPVTPEDLLKSRRLYQIKSWKGRLYISKWPKKRGLIKSDVQQAWSDQFGCLGFFTKVPEPHVFDQAVKAARGTGWYARDVLAAAANGHLFWHEGVLKITTPTASVYRSTGQVFTPNTVNALTPNNVDWDNNQFWDGVTNPTHLTCKAAGLYYVDWVVEYESKAQAPATVTYIFVNGVQIDSRIIIGAAGVGLNNSGSLLWYFAQNDYLELKSYYNPTSRNTYMRRLQLVGITPEIGQYG